MIVHQEVLKVISLISFIYFIDFLFSKKVEKIIKKKLSFKIIDDAIGLLICFVCIICLFVCY